MNAQAAVVLPAFNGAETIAAALVSIDASAHAAGRRIVVSVADDGSSDETVAVVEAFRPRGPVTIELTVRTDNGGTGAARNTAAAAVDAPVLLFLDQDDEFLPSHIGTCLEVLDAHPRLDYVTTGVRLDRPVEAEWKARIENSLTQNVAVRRWAHRWIGGFLDDAATATVGCDDVFYRRLLGEHCRGSEIGIETVAFRHRPGNSFDRQLEKFQRPPAEAAVTMGTERAAALSAANEAFERRRAAIGRKARWLGRAGTNS